MSGLDSLWSFLRAPAIHVAVARDAFVVDLSWFGVLLILVAMLLWHRLRRR